MESLQNNDILPINNEPPEIPVEPVAEMLPKNNNKIIIYVGIALLFLIVAGSAAAYYTMTRKEPIKDENVANNEVASQEKENEASNSATDEPDSSGIDQTPPVVVETKPVPTPAPAKTTPAVTEKKAPTPPANNKSPEVSVLSYGLEGGGHDSDRGLLITARASDPDGTISKVEIYIDGHKEATILPYNIGGKGATWVDDPEDIFDVTDKVTDWLEDKKQEDDIGYVYRVSRKWDKPSESCGISEGFEHMFIGKTKIYDVRSSKDLDDNVICKEATTMSYEDLYDFLWSPKGGSHDTYAIAYDQYGTSTKSNKVEFEIE